MSYINVLPRIKQWICPKQWSSQSTRMSPGCYSSGYSEHSRLSAFRLPEYFRNVPLQSRFFKLKLDPLCSSYSLPHPIPESVFTLLRVSCGSITEVSSWSPSLIQLEILGFTPGSVKVQAEPPHWAHDPASALPELAPHSQDLLWLTTLQSCWTPHPFLFFFQKTSLVSFTIKIQTSISFTFLFCLLFVCFYLCFFFCCVCSLVFSFCFVRGQNPHGWSLGMWWTESFLPIHHAPPPYQNSTSSGKYWFSEVSIPPTSEWSLLPHLIHVRLSHVICFNQRI